MPKIYERNPDTDEVREREMIEPKPYRNEMVEVLDVLKRIDLKLEFLASRDKNDYTSYQTWLDTRDEQTCILYARYNTIERDDYLPSANPR